MQELNHIVDMTSNLSSTLSDYSLSDLYSLRDCSDFGTEAFDKSGLSSFNHDFIDARAFCDLFESPIPIKIFSSYLHRTLCAAKALQLWSRYKRVYTIDGDWYNDFISTDTLQIDFSLLGKLPYDSFYIDLSLVNLPHTKHYQDVTGVIVNVIDSDNIHLTVVDMDNIQYNPVRYYGVSDLVMVSMVHPLRNNIEFRGICSKSDFKRKYDDGLTFGDYVKEFGEYQSIKSVFPESWHKYDVGDIHFVDFMLNRVSDGTMVKGKSSDAARAFCWESHFGGVIESNDLCSPVISEITCFVLQFLYFLHSKTNDIVEQSSTVHNCHKSGHSSVTDSHWNVGFYYGNKIRTLNRKCRLYGDHICTGEHGHPRAYVRSAHWHNYWCGSGEDRHLELRWLEPTYCNGTISDIIIGCNEVTDSVDCSNGERLIAAYLNKCGVSYESEYDVIIKGHHRRFDFCVTFHQQMLFIEFDGEQHFKPVEQFGGVSEFKSRQIADWNKNKYAKQHKIPLLRIRYDQICVIPDLIDSFFEHPSLRCLNSLLTDKEYYNQF